MTKHSFRQAGSTRTIVLIILAVAVVGALGFFAWKNFIQDNSGRSESASVKEGAKDAKDDINQQGSESKDVAAGEVDAYAGWKTYDGSRDGYSIKYPGDWKLEMAADGSAPYFRNLDLSPGQPHSGGYPAGYISISVGVEPSGDNFKAMAAGLTTQAWYDALGVSAVRQGPLEYEPKDVHAMTVNGLSAKSAKAVFTETSENIYLIKNGTLYSVSLYPYGISSDPTVKLVLDSFSLK